MSDIVLLEDRIRERAYFLWEQEGRPEGRADEFWEQAQREIEVEATCERGLPPSKESLPPKIQNR